MKTALKPRLEDTLKGRQPIRHVPQGSPLAGPVVVKSLATGEYIRTEQPFAPAKRDTPGYTIEQHTGESWASKQGRYIEDHDANKKATAGEDIA